MAKYRNTVPLGQEGTGAATILGPSRALNHWLGVTDRQQQSLMSQQQQYQATQQGYNQQFGKDINKSVTDSASPLWSSDISKLGSELLSRGGQMRSQGINPYSTNITPENQEMLEGFRGDTNKLLEISQKAKDIRTWQDDTIKQIMKSPGDYRQEDIDAVRNIDKNHSFEDLVAGNIQLPQIQPKINFQDEANKAKFSATITAPEETAMPDGGIRTETKTRLNTELATQFMDNAFKPGTTYAKEVEARMRENGIEGSFGQLRGTTDKDEIREYIDGYLRSSDESNPVIDLIAKGEIPAIGTPEYNRFLDDAVNEQLKAERILDDAKKEFFTGLQANVKESDKVSYNYGQAQQKIRLENQAMKRISHNLSVTNSKLDIAKKKGEATEKDPILDITISSGDGNSKYVLAGASAGSGSTTPFFFNVSKDAFETNSQTKVSGSTQERGSLVGVGVIAVNKKTGEPMTGHPTQYIGDESVDFVKKAQIYSERTEESYLEDPAAISNSLAGENAKFAKRSNQSADEYKSEIDRLHGEALKAKKAPKAKTENKNTSSNKKVINW